MLLSACWLVDLALTLSQAQQCLEGLCHQVLADSLGACNRLPSKGRLNLEFATPRGKREMALMNDAKLAAFVDSLSEEHMANVEKLSLVHLFSSCQLLTGRQVSAFSSQPTCKKPDCTMRFGSTAKVLLKCKLKYYRISE